MATELDVIFLGYQPCQVSVLNQHFEDHLGHHHQGLMVFETLVQYGHLMWLIAQEDYIKFTHLHLRLKDVNLLAFV
jgi:hypothetical protein